jgi:hypothetical protein
LVQVVHLEFQQIQATLQPSIQFLQLVAVRVAVEAKRSKTAGLVVLVALEQVEMEVFKALGQQAIPVHILR